MKKIFCSIGLCLSLLLLFSVSEATADAEEEFRQTYRISPGTAVTVENVNGDIHVSSWDNDYVDVRAVKRTNRGQDDLDLVTIEVINNGSLNIKTVYHKYDQNDDSFFRRSFKRFMSSGPKVNVNYTVKIPKQASLDDVKTVNGTVSIVETHGDTETYSTNGNVEVTRTNGKITAATTNGNVYVVDADCITKANAVNGNLKITLPGVMACDSELSTVNGSIDIFAAFDMNADVDFKTVNGSIKAQEFSVTISTVSKKELVGRLRDGGNRIKAKTVNGSIQLQRK
ncbi:MAG: hypothetical protein JXB48_18200 [Candidatus Latescibacteria bacterium]|nr:hypothetical protein [Candidatus Latescibacterota bacterium]